MAGVLDAPAVAQNDVVGLIVRRESVVADSEGGGVKACVELLRNGEKVGVAMSGLHLVGRSKWFFAVSGESEQIALVRLAV